MKQEGDDELVFGRNQSSGILKNRKGGRREEGEGGLKNAGLTGRNGAQHGTPSLSSLLAPPLHHHPRPSRPCQSHPGDWNQTQIEASTTWSGKCLTDEWERQQDQAQALPDAACTHERRHDTPGQDVALPCPVKERASRKANSLTLLVRLTCRNGPPELRDCSLGAGFRPPRPTMAHGDYRSPTTVTSTPTAADHIAILYSVPQEAARLHGVAMSGTPRGAPSAQRPPPDSRAHGVRSLPPATRMAWLAVALL
jgi:hypothetical protein